ncbi:MAG: hypothetical protein UT32_C0009G0024 [Parcubacteria group bacterium GW2011_GWC2_39_14]|nr:MAG: hypothetical protein UT32_C0009G0024 [Parcubacteria group bacterium GW2011_GWC2_39_14]KKR55363.1 MAG: hypothetical protein UT91_C0002G0024 [Parcubacteria group bacterium GW2011_GWA2_40_23]
MYTIDLRFETSEGGIRDEEDPHRPARRPVLLECRVRRGRSAPDLRRPQVRRRDVQPGKHRLLQPDRPVAGLVRHRLRRVDQLHRQHQLLLPVRGPVPGQGDAERDDQHLEDQAGLGGRPQIPHRHDPDLQAATDRGAEADRDDERLAQQLPSLLRRHRQGQPYVLLLRRRSLRAVHGAAILDRHGLEEGNQQPARRRFAGPLVHVLPDGRRRRHGLRRGRRSHRGHAVDDDDRGPLREGAQLQPDLGWPHPGLPGSTLRKHRGMERAARLP